MIDLEKLKRAVEAALGEARQNMGAFQGVNWADLRVVDIELRQSLIYDGVSGVHVIVEGADCPELRRFLLRRFLQGKLQETLAFPGVIVEVEW